MITFLDYLKQHPETPEYAMEIKSYLIKQSFGSTIIGKEESITISKKESAMLIKMENYVNTFSEVTDIMFDEMLNNKHLRKYQQLASEYSPIGCGIASDLRCDGWREVARFIVGKRNDDARIEKALSCQLPKITKEIHKQIEEDYERT